MGSRMRGAALAIAALLLAGCAAPGPGVGGSGAGSQGEGTPTPSPTAVPLPEGISVEFMQLRADVAKRAAQVRVVNGSDTDLEITRLSFEDDWFVEPAVRDRVSQLPAGRTLDLTIQLAPSECDDEPEPSDRVSRVVIEYSAEGSAFTSTADLPDPLEVIPALHARECLLSDLERSTAVAFTAFQPSETGQAATLTLTLTPTGEAASEVTAIRSTNLLSVGQVDTAADVYPLGVVVREGTTDPIVIDLPLVPFRCDPHAVQEDKRGTIFALDVAIDGQAGDVNLAAPEEMKGQILDWVADWCQFGS
ncbi:hypothetical protein ACPW96_12415 [Micromonospora sp. DT81.3]|uniref:hypothetical protein n=1 Tax=Micromonospora sp. DT81.3 TaxID=3416523 RepID=UPI003CEB11A5